MAIKIDEEACISCGVCASTCPSTFEMAGDKAKVINADSTDDCVAGSNRFLSRYLHH